MLPRPSEVTSKKPVSRFREVIPVERNQTGSHDPRFDEQAGTFSKDLFKKSFHFIDEMRKDEKFQVLKELKKTRNIDRKKKLQVLLQQMVYVLDTVLTQHTLIYSIGYLGRL